MLWTFYRDDRCLNYEIRQPFDRPGFDLIIRNPDGTEVLERFADSESLNRRTLELQNDLRDAGWFVAGDPRR